jgi:Zn-dependent alcohol dehydrogenase
MHWRPGTGIQSQPPKYQSSKGVINAGWVTTFNKHAIVSENRVTRVSSEFMSLPEIMPLLGCALTTALGVIQNEAQIKLQDKVLIFGAGGVGLLLVKLLKLYSTVAITVVDIELKKLELARKFGADTTIKFISKEQTTNELVTSFSRGFPSVAIDTTGVTSCIEMAYEMSEPDARIVLVGVPPSTSKSQFNTLPLHFGKKITGTEGGGAIPESDIPFLMELMSRNLLELSDYPLSRFKLEDVNQALDSLKSGTPGRILIDFGAVYE